MSTTPLGILYVDADEEATAVLPRFLALAGPVRTAGTLAQARAMALEEAPGLLVLDCILPDGDGAALVTDIRKHSPWVQVFALFGPGAANETSRFIAAGAGDVAVKPFDVGTLAERCARLLRSAEAARRETAHRQQLEARVSHAERIATLGTLAATIAHEISNSLSSVMCNAELLVEELRAAPPLDASSRALLSESAADVLLAARTIQAYVERIRAFSRRGQEARVDQDLSQVVDTALLLLKPRIHLEGITLVHPAGKAPRCPHLAVRLTQAVLNIVSNAIEAGGQGSTIAIRYLEGPSEVGIEVLDSGPGFDEGTRAQLFEPFFTTKATGTGLGLVVIQDVAREHGGRFELIPRHGAEGTAARLFLPASAPAA